MRKGREGEGESGGSPLDRDTAELDEDVDLQKDDEIEAEGNLGKDAGEDFDAKIDEDIEDGADEVAEEAAKVGEDGDALELDVDRDDGKDGDAGFEDELR